MDYSRLASRLDNIAPFHVMELAKMAAALEQQGRDIIHMGIGEPDFTAAAPVIAAAAQAMADGRMQYTSATGLPALRQAISRHYADVYGLEIAPSRIIVTAGASAALVLACAALVDKGAEVLMPDPSYPCNRHFVAAFDGVARMIPSGPEHRFSYPKPWCWNTGTMRLGAYCWRPRRIRPVRRSAMTNCAAFTQWSRRAVASPSLTRSIRA